MERRLARQWTWRRRSRGTTTSPSDSSPSLPLSDCLPALCCCTRCLRGEGRKRRRREEGQAEGLGGAAVESSEEEGEEAEGPFTDRVGGLPLLPCPSPPSSPLSPSLSPSLPYHCPPLVRWPLCGACRAVMALVCQMQTPLSHMQVEEEEEEEEKEEESNTSHRLGRLLAVFACPREKCWEWGAETEAAQEEVEEGAEDLGAAAEETRQRGAEGAESADDEQESESLAAFIGQPNGRSVRSRRSPFSRERCTASTHPPTPTEPPTWQLRSALTSPVSFSVPLFCSLSSLPLLVSGGVSSA